MLKIQVLGKGLIPRGHGIAPKKQPFPADLTLIGLILGTPGLEINYINPETGKAAPLTRENYQKVYAKYPNGTVMKIKVVEADGLNKEGIELAADGVLRETVITPATPVVQQEVSQAPPQEEQTPPVVTEEASNTTVAPVVTEEAPKLEEDKPAEFTMKPIMAPEEKPKSQQPQQNNNNRYQQNGQRR